MGRRIHLAAPGGGAACGAHGGAFHTTREVLSTDHLTLVDCRKCRATDRYQIALNPAQYQLRLFTAYGQKLKVPYAIGQVDDKEQAA